MEPGEYLTNVLSSNEFAYIKYEYFEPNNATSSSARKQLQNVEAAWRQEGKLLHCDPYRDGLWVFQRCSNPAPDHQPRDGDLLSPGVVEVHGIVLIRRDQGLYEPASLARSKIANAINTPTSSASPSSSLDNTLRSTQALNARSAQANSLLNVVQEPPPPSPGTKPEYNPSQKDIHEYFITAVLGSLSYLLCRDYGLIPLNARTLILDTSKTLHPSSIRSRRLQSRSSIELTTLDISLTSLGSLVVKATTDPAPGLRALVSSASLVNSVNAVIPGTALWLAPSGNAARFHSNDEEHYPSTSSIAQLQASPGKERSNMLSSLSVRSWKSRCLDWLSLKGLDPAMLEAGGWVFVQIHRGQSPYASSDYQSIPMLEDLTVVPWPTLLCFRNSSSAHQDQYDGEALSSSFRDPISFAEEWFRGKDERASLLLKRQKERQAAEAFSQEQAAFDARGMHAHTYSPVALRRGSNAGAMYPTPPDAPQHVVGATPTFEGNVTTPGNHNLNAHADIALPGQLAQNTTDQDMEMWSSEKKEQATSSAQYVEHETETDNLFGDIGADLFGTDITDADFSFFDEPDAVEFDERQASPTPALPAASGIAASDFGITHSSLSTHFPQKPDVSLHTSSPAALQDSQHQYESAMEVIDDTNKELLPAKVDDDSNTGGSICLAAKAPFDRETVFDLLTKANSSNALETQSRRASQFNKIDFENALQAVNEKYDARGSFNFKSSKRRPSTNFSQLPRTDYLNRKRKTQDHRSDMEYIARILTEKASLNQSISMEPMDYLVDTSFASPFSEQDDSSNATDNTLTQPKGGVKRKWTETNRDDMASSFDAMAMEVDRSVSTPQSMNGPQMPLLEADPADWSLTTYFTSIEPDIQLSTLSDNDSIATAQILADQAISGTLSFPGISRPELIHHKASNTRKLLQKLAKATKCCLKELAPCTLRAFIDIQGLPVLSQALRIAPRPMPNPQRPGNVDGTRQSSPFSIAPPQLEIRRADSKLSISPAAVSFWENLGLAPAKGAKDVSAVCIWPDFSGVYFDANTFLDQMRSVYESSRLGNHDRLVTKDLHNGLLSFTVDMQHQNRSQQLAVLKETTANLSKVLSSLTVEDKNLVVYFVYPPDNNTLLVHICSAFQHLFNVYRKSLSEKKMKAANEIVLQLIPLDFISSPTSIVVPRPAEYFCLALEVYDRCVDFSSTSSSPAIMLEQPLPRSIDFKLNPNPSASLLQENTCLHVAYAQSIDDRWITAAWTDNRGTQQMTASYCLGRKNEPISMAFSTVANEIWETTLDYISSKRIHWRIMIARLGVMDPSEIEAWTSLASASSNAQVNLTLITVQTEPSLRLLPPPVVIGPNGNSTNSSITPVSTPQAFQSSVLSPENTLSGTPIEGQAEPDGDARLIDYTDQSWGVVLAHRLNNSNSLLELNLALISGYLVKRSGSNSDDPPIVMEVNIVHSEVLGNPRTFHESLLREVLGYYRGLGTLARVRGMVDPVRDVRPWHIAAAEKAVKVLYILM